MFDLREATLAPDEKELLKHPAAGGIILFTRNFVSPEQVSGLIADIRAVRPELLIAVDHEGGRVQRFREGFTRLPPAAAYAQAWSGERLRTALETAGWLLAAELRAVGVDFSFAPVLDVDCGVSEIIGDRAFSRDPQEVADYASTFASGLRRAGMAAVGKHFPGHGAVALDSHLTLPVDPRPYAEIEARDLLPFQALIAQGLEAVMPAHVVYSAVDSRPAGFSPYWIKTVLRERLGFDGAVFSDDLSMEGAAGVGGYAERTRLALEAGCDVVLVCNRPEAIAEVLESAASHSSLPRQDRLERLRGRYAIDRTELLQSSEWRQAVAALAELATH
ncbi:beta-N-acetylhexosaminidase [Methylococcus sp. EFPC2]|nr:beta-N-acetylhexosaminidase [Methylococcus sp. EFPC2]